MEKPRRDLDFWLLLDPENEEPKIRAENAWSLSKYRARQDQNVAL